MAARCCLRVASNTSRMGLPKFILTQFSEALHWNMRFISHKQFLESIEFRKGNNDFEKFLLCRIGIQPSLLSMVGSVLPFQTNSVMK